MYLIDICSIITIEYFFSFFVFAPNIFCFKRLFLKVYVINYLKEKKTFNILLEYQEFVYFVVEDFF